MQVPALPVAQRAALTELLGDPEVDIAATLTMLADEGRLAAPSFLGISVLVAGAGSGLQVDVMAGDLGDVMAGVGSVGRIQSSFFIPTSKAIAGVSHGDGPTTRPSIALVLYAAVPGALVDLAADLAWLTSLPLADFVLDHHLRGPEPSRTSTGMASLVNQAIGVLLGRGQTPDEAYQTLADHASAGGVTRASAAETILAEVTGPRRDLDPLARW